MAATKQFRKRNAILEYLQETDEHPSAEMVYNNLKPQIPDLSLGTVYRNLHQMAEEGRIMEIPGTVVRFDANTAPHTHFSCCECGGVSDLDMPYDTQLDQIVEQNGCRVQTHNLMFYGICPACMGQDHA